MPITMKASRARMTRPMISSMHVSPERGFRCYTKGSKTGQWLVRSGIHLLQPVLQVVMIAHTRDPAAGNVEKGPDPQSVGLAPGWGQAIIRMQVAAAEHELGGSVFAVPAVVDDRLLHALLVAGLHVRQELAEFRLALARRALAG